MRKIITTISRAIIPSLTAFKSINHFQYYSLSLIQPKGFYLSTNSQNYRNLTNSTFEGPGFYTEQLLVGCLSIFSYYLQSGDQALLIDPENDISIYVQILNRRGKKLKGVFLTHYHADFIAGHQQLQLKYGCKIYMGPSSVANNNLTILNDGQKITFGNSQLQLIHTPGHTLQSSCLLLYDPNNQPVSLYSGDTVFINQVGRPDLAVNPNMSAKDLAQKLFDSLQKIKALNDDIRLYPGHGAGSACGKSIGAGNFCTIGLQKVNNYALKQTNKSKFVQVILNEMPKSPQYFAFDAQLNKHTHFNYQQAFKKALKQLNPTQVHQLLSKQKVVIIDVRQNNELIKKGIIKGSICIGFNGAFANWVGTLLNPQDKYIIYVEPSQTEDTIKRLLRIGYKNILGFFKFDIDQWKNNHYEFNEVQMLGVNEIEPGRTILDIRKQSQCKLGILNCKDHLKLELSQLFKDVSKLDKTKKYSIHCAAGYRSKIAYSFLKNNGYDVKYYPFPFNKIATETKLGIKN